MKLVNNPFELMTYLGPQYFCDREEEIRILNHAFDNRRNIVISSLRRLGKTNLIFHWHYKLEQEKKVKTIYLDILHTKNDQEFLSLLVNSAYKLISDQKNILQRVLNTLSNIRPTVSIDPFTNQPNFSFEIADTAQLEQGIDFVFGLLSRQFDKIQIAIDEFQVISTYEKTTKIDAILRSCLSKYQGFHMLFSGSQENMLTTLFSDPQKPMFGSTQHISLGKIGYRPYFEFIKNQFETHGQMISDEAIHEILIWTKMHTFYTHFLANEVFSSGGKVVDLGIVKRAEEKVIKLFEVNFINILKNFPSSQRKVLVAIAKEGEARNVYNKEFLSKYKLAASSTSQAIGVLEKKDILKKDFSSLNESIFIQDVFFSRYLEYYF